MLFGVGERGEGEGRAFEDRWFAAGLAGLASSRKKFISSCRRCKSGGSLADKRKYDRENCRPMEGLYRWLYEFKHEDEIILFIFIILHLLLDSSEETIGDWIWQLDPGFLSNLIVGQRLNSMSCHCWILSFFLSFFLPSTVWIHRIVWYFFSSRWNLDVV